MGLAASVLEGSARCIGAVCRCGPALCKQQGLRRFLFGRRLQPSGAPTERCAASMLHVLLQAQRCSNCQGVARGAAAAAAPRGTQASRLNPRWPAVGNRGCSGSCASPRCTRTSRLEPAAAAAGALRSARVGLCLLPRLSSAVCCSCLRSCLTVSSMLFVPQQSFACSSHAAFTLFSLVSFPHSLHCFATCFPPADLFW